MIVLRSGRLLIVIRNLVIVVVIVGIRWWSKTIVALEAAKIGGVDNPLISVKQFRITGAFLHRLELRVLALQGHS